jgi:two-component system sensor histidine kinase GlrK
MFAVVQVDGLAGTGRRAVLDTAQAVKAGRIIVEQITAMERSARQYQILRDQSFYQHYVNRREEFTQAIALLSDLDLEIAQLSSLNQLIGLEQQVFDALETAALEEKAAPPGIADVPPMVELARSFSFEISQYIASDADEMRRQAKKSKRVLALISIALIPTTLVMVATFTVLITKPLRRIDQEIRRLGSGEFSTPITVGGGPQDLRELNIRLEWLRMRLNELEEQKTSFLRGISHELKTPLSAIREGAELLNDGVVGALSVEQQEVATILRDNSVRLQMRIEDLLKFNVALSQPSRLTLSRFRLDKVIQKVIADHRLSSRSKNLVIDTNLSELMMLGDREKVRIIVDNLLSNAIKFSPIGGRIRMGIACYDDVVLLDIQDEGQGIASKDRNRVFDAFYKGRFPDKGHVKGTGLGLAIVKEYVKAHHGEISILDQEKGTHMRVYLPVTSKQIVKI